MLAFIGEHIALRVQQSYAAGRQRGMRTPQPQQFAMER
jgi:hypothetical protein